jgi:tetratricopeptide (TPR) repeat protein
MDPDYAWAYAALAEAYGHLAFFGQADFAKAWAAAEAAALHAIELDPVLGEAHLSLGLLKLFYHWEFDEAYQRIQKALTRNPGLARTHHAFGIYLTIIGEPGRAVEEFETAVRLDPLSLPFMMSLGWGHLNSGHFEEAIATHDRILSLDPMFSAACEAKGIALLHQGNFAEAMRMFQRVIQISGDPWKCLGPRGQFYALTGQTVEARRMIEMAHERARLNPGVSVQFELASIHTALGEIDQAIEYLDEAARRRLGDVPFLVNVSFWAGLRRHPAFWSFLERHGLRRIARGQPPA